MGRVRKSKDKFDQILDLLFGPLLLLGIYVWSKTRSVQTAVITSVIGFIVLFVIRILYDRSKNKRNLESGINQIDTMSGEAFEEFLLAHFGAQDYKGHLTPSTEDYGADLVLEKDGRKLVVQAKRWKRNVGIEAVQQVIGAIKHYDAQKGMVITNSYFSENAYALADSNGIELWDRPKLIELMSKSDGRQLANNVAVKSIISKPVSSQFRGSMSTMRKQTCYA